MSLEHSEELAGTLGEIRSELRAIRKDVDLLNEKVLVGNGKDSILTQLKSIQDYIEDNKNKKADTRWSIGAWFAGINSLAAFGALCVGVYAIFH